LFDEQLPALAKTATVRAPFGRRPQRHCKPGGLYPGLGDTEQVRASFMRCIAIAPDDFGRPRHMRAGSTG